METKILLDRLSPYISPHKHFDVATSKYGPLYVYPVDRKGESHEAEMLGGPKEIVETVVFQMICDVMESAPKNRTRPTEGELSSVRIRIRTLVLGSEFEDEVMSFADRYIEQYKNYEW